VNVIDITDYDVSFTLVNTMLISVTSADVYVACVHQGTEL